MQPQPLDRGAARGAAGGAIRTIAGAGQRAQPAWCDPCLDIHSALKDRDSYCVRAGVESVRVASVGSCLVEAAGAGGAAAGARLTTSPQAASA